MERDVLLKKLEEFQSYKRLRDEAAERVDVLGDEIKEYMKSVGEETLRVGDYKVMFKSISKSSLDSKRLIEDHPEMIDQYMKLTEYHRLTVL